MKRHYRRRRALSALGALGTAALAGCASLRTTESTQQETTATTSRTATSTSTTSRTTTTDSSEAETKTACTDESQNGPRQFAVLPTAPRDAVFDRYAGLASYLDEEIGPLELTYGTDVQSVVEGVADGTFAFAETGPVTAALASRAGDAEIALQRYAYGSWNYGSRIVAHKDSDVESLADVPGASVAFADPTSPSGSIVPLSTLADAGIEIGSLPTEIEGANFDAEFGGHAIAYKSVVSHQVDVACAGEFIFEYNEEPGNELVSLSTTDGIPRAPILASPTLPDDVTQSFVDAMVNAPERAYLGADGERDTDDDLWFTDVREIDAAAYEDLATTADTVNVDIADLTGEF